MKVLRHETLDDVGNCYADEVKPGVWHVHRIDPFGGKHVVILTSDSIKHLAAIA